MLSNFCTRFLSLKHTVSLSLSHTHTHTHSHKLKRIVGGIKVPLLGTLGTWYVHAILFLTPLSDDTCENGRFRGVFFPISWGRGEAISISLKQQTQCWLASTKVSNTELWTFRGLSNTERFDVEKLWTFKALLYLSHLPFSLKWSEWLFRWSF